MNACRRLSTSSLSAWVLFGLIAFAPRPAGAETIFQTQGGPWRFHGLAGKCLDVGSYPTTLSSPAILFDCNGTAAQDITIVPLGDGTNVELRANNRCLTIRAKPLVLAPAAAAPAIPRPPLALAAAAPAISRQLNIAMDLVLTPCSSDKTQSFVSKMLGNGYIVPSTAPQLRVTVSGANSANRTPLILSPAANPEFPELSQEWRQDQVDTTPYDWAPVVAAAGAFSFTGLAGKCIDVGAPPHGQHSPAFLYGCNGSIAQYFSIRTVNEHLGSYNLLAFGLCFTVGRQFHTGRLPAGGGALLAGAPIELDTCSGAADQEFSFDNFDRHFIYPAGRPDLVVGVRGAGTDNHTPLELQVRSGDRQDWRAVAVEHPDVGPKAPSIRFSKALDKSKYQAALEIRDGSKLATAYEVDWKPLGDGAYTSAPLSGSVSATSSNFFFLGINGTRKVYVAKARAIASNGLFSESPAIIIDGRDPDLPAITIEDVKDDQVSIAIQAAGTPQIDTLIARAYPMGTLPTNSSTVDLRPGDGAANLTYQNVLTGLRPNTPYEVDVEAVNDLWGGTFQTTYVTTPPAPTPNQGPFATTIWLIRQEIHEGYIAFSGSFGPINTGATVSNINFPTQFPPFLLITSGNTAQSCGDPTAFLQVQGNLTAADEKAVWGTSSIHLAGTQKLNFVGCGTGSQLFNMLPVNITWSTP